MTGPKPLAFLFRKKRSGLIGMIVLPEKGHLRGLGIGAGLNGDAIADEFCCLPVLFASGVDKSIREKPERAIAAQRDRISVIGSGPTGILPKELIGLRPSRSEVIVVMRRAMRQAAKKKNVEKNFAHSSASIG